MEQHQRVEGHLRLTGDTPLQELMIIHTGALLPRQQPGSTRGRRAGQRNALLLLRRIDAPASTTVLT